MDDAALHVDDLLYILIREDGVALEGDGSKKPLAAFADRDVNGDHVILVIGLRDILYRISLDDCIDISVVVVECKQGLHVLVHLGGDEVAGAEEAWRPSLIV